MEAHRLDDKCHRVNTALKNNMVDLFKDACLSPLINPYTRYTKKKTTSLIPHIYKKYARVSATDVALYQGNDH